MSRKSHFKKHMEKMNKSYKEVIHNKIIYGIDEEEKTAAVIDTEYVKGSIFIPRSIMHDSQEYIVTSIFNNAFTEKFDLVSVQFPPDSELRSIHYFAFGHSNITSITIPKKVTMIDDSAFFYCRKLKTLNIPSDSELRTIKKSAFAMSPIESILIPSSVDDLEDNWCEGTSCVNHFEVMPNNEHYMSFNDDFILGKSSEKSDVFDVLVFARRDITDAMIPSFIKKISPHAFSGCRMLKHIVFPDDSELEIICSRAFCSAGIESIAIPQRVKVIGERAFMFCDHLKEISFAENSELVNIEQEAFYKSAIESITIPSSVKTIGTSCFIWCSHLKEIIFPEDSQIRVIEGQTFYGAGVKSITFPPSLVKLNKGWCERSGIKDIKFMPNNKHFMLYNNEFILGKSDENNDAFDVLVLAKINIKYAVIPSFITHIASLAFSNCMKLRSVTFQKDSMLQEIDDEAFYSVGISQIVIPKHVKRIGMKAFGLCPYLSRVEFEENSEIQQIDEGAFSYSEIQSISFPACLTSIGRNIFYSCEKLKIVEIPEEWRKNKKTRNVWFNPEMLTKPARNKTY